MGISYVPSENRTSISVIEAIACPIIVLYNSIGQKVVMVHSVVFLTQYIWITPAVFQPPLGVLPFSFGVATFRGAGILRAAIELHLRPAAGAIMIMKVCQIRSS